MSDPRTLGCGRRDEHDEHTWNGRDVWRPSRIYRCTGHVLTTLAEKKWADRADFNDKRDDELREWLREGWAS